MLLHHLHPLLQRQSLEYRVFVINQAGRGTFNRGKLLNSGFKEVSKLDSSFQCYIFQDVDLLPEDYRLRLWGGSVDLAFFAEYTPADARNT